MRYNKYLKKIIKVFAYFVYPLYKIHNILIKRLLTILSSNLVEIKIKHMGNSVGENFRMGKNGKLKINNGAKITIGKNVLINEDVYINVRENARLKIGDNVHIGKGVRISSFKSIVIGDDVLIASYCNLIDHNHTFDLKSPASTKHYDIDEIKLENGCWLGTKVQINKGVTVGKYSVVGANSVVTKEVLKSSVYAGVPAKKIKCLDK